MYRKSNEEPSINKSISVWTKYFRPFFSSVCDCYSSLGDTVLLIIPSVVSIPGVCVFLHLLLVPESVSFLFFLFLFPLLLLFPLPHPSFPLAQLHLFRPYSLVFQSLLFTFSSLVLPLASLGAFLSSTVSLPSPFAPRCPVWPLCLRYEPLNNFFALRPFRHSFFQCASFLSSAIPHFCHYHRQRFFRVENSSPVVLGPHATEPDDSRTNWAIFSLPTEYFCDVEPRDL